MSTIEIIITLPEDLVKDARELDLLTDDSVAELLQAEIERRKMEVEDEAQWDEAILTQALSEALRPDGSIDFDKLEADGIVVPLDELHPESDLDEQS